MFFHTFKSRFYAISNISNDFRFGASFALQNAGADVSREWNASEAVLSSDPTAATRGHIPLL
jgi:hypothetical protein